LAHDSDENLFLRSTETAMTRLVGRYERPLYRFLHRLCGDAHTAEDLFQETFLRLFRSRARFHPQRKLRPYLYRIALNLVRDTRKRRRRRPRPLSLDVPSGAGGDGRALIASDDPPPAVRAEAREARSLVHSAIDALPPNEQEVVILRFFEGFTFPEIATATGAPLATAKSRMLYALRRLRPLLEHQVLEEPPVQEGRS
jgi:RNA polymerase sigma-70 factor (ECF subfamily)